MLLAVDNCTLFMLGTTIFVSDRMGICTILKISPSFMLSIFQVRLEGQFGGCPSGKLFLSWILGEFSNIWSGESGSYTLVHGGWTEPVGVELAAPGKS